MLQTGLLDICEQRRSLSIEAVDLHNEAQDKLIENLEYPNWFERWFLGRR